MLMYVLKFRTSKKTNKSSKLLLVLIILFLVSGTMEGGFRLKPVIPGYNNEVGLGLSYGIKLSKDAWFWGYAPDYVRVLGDKWLLNISFAYDLETETKSEGKAETETWTPSLMIGYQLGDRFAAGIGLGHGLIDNKDSGGWNWVKFGNDLSIAAAGAVTLWNEGRHGLALSVSLEYNISDNEPSFSTDLGYAWAF